MKENFHPQNKNEEVKFTVKIAKEEQNLNYDMSKDRIFPVEQDKEYVKKSNLSPEENIKDILNKSQEQLKKKIEDNITKKKIELLEL